METQGGVTRRFRHGPVIDARIAHLQGVLPVFVLLARTLSPGVRLAMGRGAVGGRLHRADGLHPASRFASWC
jgi:hypothetical protein